MKRIAWTEQAKADVRGLDKPTAMRILSALHRFAESGTGDIKALQGDAEEHHERRTGSFGWARRMNFKTEPLNRQGLAARR